MIHHYLFAIFVFFYQAAADPTFSEPSVTTTTTAAANVDPIIFSGGIGGIALEAYLKDVHPPHWWCSHNHEWFRIWMNIYEEIPYLSQDCFMHNFEIIYDKETRSFRNQQGVSIRPVDFGGMGSMEYLSDISFLKKKSAYMHEFMEYYKTLGYEMGKSFRGGPYDWRVGPNEFMNDGIYEQYKGLIEETYLINGNKSVVLIGHSNGCPFVSYFLAKYVNEEWKDTYVKAFISLGGPYDGASTSAFLQILGFTYYQPFLKPTKQWKSIIDQVGGLQWLVPVKYDQERVFMENAKGEKYTFKDIKKLYNASDAEVSIDIYDLENQHDKTLAPGVETYCIYGQNIETPYNFYIDDFLNPVDVKITKNVTGDGTVEDSSLYVCDSWGSQQKQPVHVMRKDKSNHVGMMREQWLWDYIKDIVVH